MGEQLDEFQFEPGQIDVLVTLFDEKDNFIEHIGIIKHVEKYSGFKILHSVKIRLNNYQKHLRITGCSCRFAFIRPEFKDKQWTNFDGGYHMTSNSFYSKAFRSRAGITYPEYD